MTKTAQRPRHVFEPGNGVKDAATLRVGAIRDGETIIAGPAGTGKSRASLEWLNLAMTKYPGARGFMGRKTRKSLTQTGMITFENHVLPGVVPRPKFHSGKQAYLYANGSQIIVGGFDDPEKLKSLEIGVAFVQECTELTETDWEMIMSRTARDGVMPYGRVVGDCNPSAPTHWIRRRARSGQLTLLESRLQENPVYFDADTQQFTPAGTAYLNQLEGLTGVRRARLLEGKWAAAEGVIYEQWDRTKHIIERDADGKPILPWFGRPEDLDGAGIPRAWRRYWSIDWGTVNPFVLQYWAQDPDGRLYMYRELYGTERIVEDWAKMALAAMTENEPRPDAIVADHDYEDRLTFHRHSGMETINARKDVTTGIQAVQARLRPNAIDGRPRLFLVANAVDEPDTQLMAAKKPYQTEDEVESYVWMVTKEGQSSKEQPVKVDDHGMDAMRYMVAHFDLGDQDTMIAPDISLSGPSNWFDVV